MKVTLLDGAAHSVDSSAIAFELAAKAAYRQSLPKAGAQLLEPIMKVDVFTPDAHVGDVIGDLNRRRAMIKFQEAGMTGVRVKAEAPLSEMFGYIGDLRTITSWARSILDGVLALRGLPSEYRGGRHPGSSGPRSGGLM